MTKQEMNAEVLIDKALDAIKELIASYKADSKIYDMEAIKDFTDGMVESLTKNIDNLGGAVNQAEFQRRD